MCSIEKPDKEVSSPELTISNLEQTVSLELHEACDSCGKPTGNWVLRKCGIRPLSVCFQCVIRWFSAARDQEGRG